MQKKILCLMSVVLLGGCTSQNEMNAMQARLQQQEQQINQLNMQLSGVQPAQADTWAQLQGLRQEMSTVRGQIDEFNNATAASGGLMGLAQRVERQQAALQAIETQFALNLNLNPNATPTDPLAPPPNTPIVQAPGSIPTAQDPLISQQNQPPQQNQQQPTKDTASTLYDAGIKSFNSRNYTHSLNSFRDFTDTYPKHSLAGNAWFWRGECNFQLGNFAAAALDYEQVISKFPQNGKAASSYLKQGMSFLRANKKDAAKIRFNELIKKFPKSPEATRAAQLLKENA